MKLWLLLPASWLACTPASTPAPDPTPITDITASTPPTKTTRPPCDHDDDVTVLDATATQPWHANEAQIVVTLSAEASVAVACTLATDPDETHLVEGVEEALTHTLRVGGLLAESEYRCVAAAVCPSSNEPPATLVLETMALTDDRLPGATLFVDQDGSSPDYVAINHHRNGSFDGQRLIVYDRQARVRWHALRNEGAQAMNYAPATGGFTTAGAWPPRITARPRLIELFGTAVAYDSGDDIENLDQLRFHHDGRQLADGRYLTLEEPVIDDGDGGTFRGVGARIVNPETGTSDFVWTSQRAFDEGDMPRGHQGDAYHVNWIDMVEQDGQSFLAMSLCYQSWVVAVDVPSGDVRWRFGPGGDFQLVDTAGKALPDTMYTECQHGLQLADGRLLVYDNGRARGYSRASEYDIDESTMTATLLWTWTEPEWFEQSLGGVDWTSYGNVMIAMGHGESFSQTPGDHTTIVEIAPETGSKLWEMRYDEITDVTYRVESVAPCNLFANAKLCDRKAERLETLADILAP